MESGRSSERVSDAKGASISKSASKVLGVAKSVPRAFMQTTTAPYESLAPMVRDQLIRELHTYPLKKPVVTRAIWAVFGILGGHRFYLGHIGIGALQLLTLGGALVWWIIDGFKLKELVDAFNQEQQQREVEGRPPIGMDYVPVVEPDVLAMPPIWAESKLLQGKTAHGQRARIAEVIADIFAVMFFGFVLGAFTAGSDYRMAAWAVGAMLIMINFADYLIPVHHWPFANGMIHWDYRLRLFYHFNQPGRRLMLYLRPLIGLFHAPFQKKHRVEVLLYLEIGSVFIATRALMGLWGGETWNLLSTFDIGGFLGLWVKSIVIGFFAIYAFAAPIGAILMKHVLLRRPNYVKWTLSLVILIFMMMGLSEA